MRSLIPAVLAIASVARAEPLPCSSELDAWEVIEGQLLPGARCGRFVARTNGSATAYSIGTIVRRDPVALPYRLRVEWRRLGSEPRALELGLVGAILMLGHDKAGLWIDDAQFARDGWRPLPGYRTHASTVIEVEQDAREVRLLVGGKLALRWPLASRATSGKVSLIWKGATGGRSSVEIARLTVDTR